MISYFTTRGIKNRIHWMENRALKPLNKYDRNNMVVQQLAPLKTHRINPAK